MHWDRLLFCAKEAVYKAWFPLTERWLGFEDAHITFGPPDRRAPAAGDGSFHSSFWYRADPDGPPLASLDGRWLVSDGLVITAIR